MAGRPKRRLAEMAKASAQASEVPLDTSKPIEGEVVSDAPFASGPYSPKAYVFGDDAKPKRKIGAPTKFNLDIAERICKALAYSDYGLEQVCSEVEGSPHHDTVYAWLNGTTPEHETFRLWYARAREIQGLTQAQRALHDAVTATDPQLGRLRYDARRWMAGKLAPRTFGDKVQLSNAAGDGDATLAIRQENAPVLSELVALLESRRQAALEQPSEPS